LNKKTKKKPKVINVDNYVRIRRALENDQYSFRTINGAAKEAKIKPADAEEAISQHSDEIVILHRRGSDGERLITTRKHYKKKATLKEKLMGAMLNCVY
jgi:hypothetical protein